MSVTFSKVLAALLVDLEKATEVERKSRVALDEVEVELDLSNAIEIDARAVEEVAEAGIGERTLSFKLLEPRDRPDPERDINRVRLSVGFSIRDEDE